MAKLGPFFVAVTSIQRVREAARVNQGVEMVPLNERARGLFTLCFQCGTAVRASSAVGC